MKNSLWVVFVIVSGFLGFLIGYSVSSYTGFQKVQQGSVTVAEAGGYGGESGGYGAESGGYGAESGGDRAASVQSRGEGEDYGERTGYFGGK
jgi:hypothetical protein